MSNRLKILAPAGWCEWEKNSHSPERVEWWERASRTLTIIATSITLNYYCSYNSAALTPINHAIIDVNHTNKLCIHTYTHTQNANKRTHISPVNGSTILFRKTHVNFIIPLPIRPPQPSISVIILFTVSHLTNIPPYIDHWTPLVPSKCTCSRVKPSWCSHSQ